jgi:hypothetical protein
MVYTEIEGFFLKHREIGMFRKYQCHKVVEAFQIRSISLNGDGFALYPCEVDEEIGDDFHRVTADFMERHTPLPGDYLVRYKDGYESISPAQAFIEGYKRLNVHLFGSSNSHDD